MTAPRRAMLLCFAYRAALGLLLGMPIAGAASQVVGAHPEGDALLYQPGGLWLLEAVRLARPAVRAHLPASALLVLLGALGWVLPLAMLIAAQRDRAASLGELARAALPAAPALALLRGLVMLLQAAGLLLASYAGRGLAGLAGGARWGDGAAVLGVLAGIVLAWALSVFEDAVRVALVAGRQSAWDAVSRAWEALVGLGRTAFAAAGWRTLVVALAFGWAAWMGWVIGAGIAPLLAHFAALAVLVAMRAEWLGWLVQRVPRGAAGLPGCRG